MKNEDNKQETFIIKYKEIIDKLQELFKNEINEKESSQIIKKLILIPCLTIFEAFNLIYREVQIIKTISKKDELKEENMELYINKNIDPYESQEFYNIIEHYKINSHDNNNEKIEKSWKPNNALDERRAIKINKKFNIYNYIPIRPICLDNNNNKELFCKNNNEYNYHPLFYKTLMCHYCNINKDKNKDNKKILLCPFSHDIQTDFRIIYDYKNENICKFLYYLYNNKLFSFVNYLNYISIEPLIFNSNEFKIFECPFKQCKEDKHLCPFYHSISEQRRPICLFRYNIDDKCFDKKNTNYNVDTCPFRFFCNGIHSQYEYNYHPKIFRKEIKCTKPKKNGHCIFIKTCYGLHPPEEYEIYKKELENDENNINEDDDDEIKKIKEKMESINYIDKCLKCRNCNNLPKKGKIKYLGECKHFLCKKCFDEVYEDGDKMCPFCNLKISKKYLVNLNFIQK